MFFFCQKAKPPFTDCEVMLGQPTRVSLSICEKNRKLQDSNKMKKQNINNFFFIPRAYSLCICIISQ